MNNVKISKVDNGYILEQTKLDVLTKRPETEVLVFTKFDDVIDYLTKEKL